MSFLQHFAYSIRYRIYDTSLLLILLASHQSSTAGLATHI
jgi:hypothetical protein